MSNLVENTTLSRLVVDLLSVESVGVRRLCICTAGERLAGTAFWCEGVTEGLSVSCVSLVATEESSGCLLDDTGGSPSSEACCESGGVEAAEEEGELATGHGLEIGSEPAGGSRRRTRLKNFCKSTISTALDSTIMMMFGKKHCPS